MLQSRQLLPWSQSLKNQVSKKYLVFFADLLTLKGNIKLSKAIKVSRAFSRNLNYNQLHINIPFEG